MPMSSTPQPTSTMRTTMSVAAIALMLACFQSCATTCSGSGSSRPNILFVLMDDLGFSDVGFRDSRFHTPTIDAMREGKFSIRFNRSYTPPNCGPSRAALLSGFYPWRLGLQGNAINSGSSAAIPQDKTILPQALQQLGYQTHLVGKWHQGFCKESQTPTKRGFDSFFGFYLSKQDHFSHMAKKEAFDFRSDLKVNRSVAGHYSTDLYTERVRQLVREYKDSVTADPEGTKPFFILLSHAAIHGPNQVPQHYIDRHCSSFDAKSERLRQQKCGMMVAVDEGLGRIMEDLKARGLTDNLLVVFTSDDGGKADEGSSNWPLRGAKRTLWEGGIRVNTFLYSEDREVLPKTDFTWSGLFYNTDFYATLHGMATGSTSKKLPSVKDSYNHWRYLKTGQADKSSRNFIVYVDQDLDVAMLIKEDLKLLRGQHRSPDWYNPLPGAKKPTPTDDPEDLPKYQLFNLRDDPAETVNLKDSMPDTADTMARRLRRYRNKTPDPINEDRHSDPDRFDGVWSPGWC